MIAISNVAPGKTGKKYLVIGPFSENQSNQRHQW
jgi:hypothetical protein